MKDGNLAKLNEIFAIVMELDEGRQAEELSRLSFDNWRQVAQDRWDSLAHTSLVAAIESEFGVTIDSAESERMTSFKAIDILLTEKGL
ncbi:MAG: acyl carrier protein [Actinomycetota bacterium]